MPHTPHRNPVEELADEFVARFRRGERPAISEYARRHPEYAAEIVEVFPALVMMEQVDSDLKHAAEADTPAPDPVPAHTQLGDFRIIREVGRGGMGIVYEAEQVSLGRRVALKLLPKQTLLDSKHQKRFLREAKAAARLHHTNIVPVFGVGHQDGLHYYVMQFIHGLGLDEVLVELQRLRVESSESRVKASGGRKPTDSALVALPAAAVAQSLLTGHFDRTLLVDSDESDQPSAISDQQTATSFPSRSTLSHKPSTHDTAVAHLSDTFAVSAHTDHNTRHYFHSIARIGLQAARALQYAHDQGIIHRDVKPGNLLLDTRGSVWVTDFGLAKAADQQDLTHTGDVLGTLRYMAPEQFDGNADARSDVFSLGLTLYELLALKPAFDETERHKLIKQVTTGAPPRLRTLDPHIPRDVETIVHKAIDRDPSHRYQTADEMAGDLHRYLGDQPIRARWISPVTRFARWCKRNPAIAALTSAMAVLLITAAVVASVAAVRFENLADHATDEQERAEGNLDLALEALDAVYLDAIGEEKLLGAPMPGSDPHDPDVVMSLRTPLTDLEKELLQRGLEFYDSFAQQNADAPRAAFETARAHCRVGLLQAALGDHRSAVDSVQNGIEHFEILLEDDPDNIDYLAQLGEAYRLLGESLANATVGPDAREMSLSAYERSIDASRRATKLDSSNPQTWMNLGKALSHAGRPDEAESAFRHAIGQNQENAWAHSLLGMMLESQGELAEAIIECQRAVDLDSDRAEFRVNLAMVLTSTGRASDSVREARQALILNPDLPQAYFQLGHALLELKEYDEAADALRRYTEFEPEYHSAFCMLGKALLGAALEIAGQSEEEPGFARAADAYRRANELGACAESLVDWGLCLYCQQDYIAAADAFRKATRFDPDNARAHHSLALALHRQLNLDEAEMSIRRAINLDPTNVASQGILEQILAASEARTTLLEASDPDAVADAFERFAELYPESHDAFCQLGDDLLAAAQDFTDGIEAVDGEGRFRVSDVVEGQRRYGVAAEVCRRAILLDPTCMKSICDLGISLFGQNDWDSAAAAFQLATDIDPDLEYAHYWLAKTYLAQQRLDEAEASIDAALDIDPTYAEAHDVLQQIHTARHASGADDDDVSRFNRDSETSASLPPPPPEARRAENLK